jgi:hypothetical protein
MTITTAMATSFKVEMLQAGHCLQQTFTATGNTNSNTTVSGLSSTANVAVGMSVSGTNIPAGATVVSIPTATSIVISAAATGTGAGVTLTFAGDTVKMALIKFGHSGVYGANTTNYSQVTGNSDEASGTGYVAGGLQINQQGPSNPSGTTAIMSYSPNPSWTSATIDVSGCLIYNSSARLTGGGRAISLHDFGGEQKVTNGTLTVNMPTYDVNNAILRIT